VSGVLSKLILIFVFVFQSTLAVGSIHYKRADLPDFHRDDGYGDILEDEYVKFIPTSTNRPTDANLIPVVFSLNSVTGWFNDDVNLMNDYVLVSLMDSFWDEYDCSWSRYIYPVLWINVTESNHIPDDELLLDIETSDSLYSELDDIRILSEQTVNAGNWLFLDVTQSVVQVDGFLYKWRQTAGKEVLINRSDYIRAWVQTPSNITRDEILEFELMVTDDKGKYIIVKHTVFLTAIENGLAQRDHYTLTNHSQD